jgi:hypothetical protein
MMKRREFITLRRDMCCSAVQQQQDRVRDPQRLGSRAREGILDFPRVARLDRYERKANLPGGVLRIVQDRGIGLGVWISQKSNAGNVRHNCRQQLQLLRR